MHFNSAYFLLPPDRGSHDQIWQWYNRIGVCVYVKGDSQQCNVDTGKKKKKKKKNSLETNFLA